MPVLITLATLALLFGGGSGAPGTTLFDYETLRRRVRTLADPDRRRQALEIIDEAAAEAQLATVIDGLQHYVDQVVRFDVDLDALAEEYIVPLDETRAGFLERMIDLRFRLHDIVDAEEWAMVFAPSSEGG